MHLLKNNIKVLLCGVLIVSLQGCATTAVDFKKNLQDSQVCCNKLADIDYKQLEYDKKLHTNVGAKKSPVRTFKEGKSFFVPVKLPAYTGPYEIQVESKPVKNQLFVPKIVLLDKNYNIRKQIPANKFQFSNGLARYKFFLNKDEGYRYLILHTSPSDIGKKGLSQTTSTQLIPIIAGPYIFYYTNASESKNIITSAEGGKVDITAIPYKPKTIGKM